MIKTRVLLVPALAAACIGFASAQIRGGDFVVTNDSDYTAISFQTAEGDKWSHDWIPGDAIAPGEQFMMAFTAPPGGCTIPTKVTFADGASFEGDVDYCRTGMLTLLNDSIVTR
jgi:hypothetical protein